MPTATELPIDSSATADQMAEEMFGDGMKIIEATFSGDTLSSGIYSNGESISSGIAPSDTGVILSTGSVENFTNASGEVNQSAGTTYNSSGADGDAGLNEIAGSDTFDAAIFEAKFIPVGDTLTMQFSFSSEEYLEYVNSGFNDAVGIWVNGSEALMTIGDGHTSINSINDTSNQNLFVDNQDDLYNTEMDGFTITLTVKAPLMAGEENTIRIGIADGGDSAYDSNLLIVGNSIQSITIAEDDTISMAQGKSKNLDVLENDNSESISLKVTHINGIAVEPGDSVTLPTGEIITLNEDGTLQIQADDDVGTNVFSYQVSDAEGNTDIGFVETTTTVPCFAKGTLISTNRGVVPVENLKKGMQVRTLLSGFKEIKWIGKVRTFSQEKHAPIVIAGGEGRPDLKVSQNHKLLVSGAKPHLLFGEARLFVAAKHMINGKSIWLDQSKEEIVYFHVLLESHEVIKANGIWSESLNPGPLILSTMSPSAREEILAINPEANFSCGHQGQKQAFSSLNKHEAQVLLN